ncbi:hypothetical protein D9615_006657 [Tricholomella constricta]|uniref:Uncharacterized protein n=1 Tax=Tricholomella constricta TaxID=117010 RepID=A0A8H5HAD8_9AGAR|nr:hypothetical protein D9615_006657 [Tricholomella constricta]
MATTTTTTMSSTHNPFRTPAATPNPTGTSAPPSSSLPANPNSAVSDTLDEDLPPAYTPGPDVHSGESTVEYGPQRPYQTAPAPAPAPSAHHRHHRLPPPIHVQPPPPHTPPSIWRQFAETIATQLTGPAQVSPHPTGGSSSSWSGYPGQQQRLHPHHTGPRPGVHPRPQAPPLPPRPASMSSSPSAANSDFARDFYAAGPGPTSEHGHVPARRPPPPPTPTPTSEDGPPTQSPTPGRALLRGGKLLVYPPGHMCSKCHNIGYKHADPSHPCKKCWSKYAKPFSGPLAYAYNQHPSSPSSSSSPSSTLGTGTGTGTTFQRPLPAFRPPRPTPVPQPPPPPPPPPRPPPRPQLQLYSAAPLPHLRTLSPYAHGPLPPNAVVYPAGDARLGGRPCWNCAGRGRESLLGFELGPCLVCGGVGRVF